MPRPTIPDRKLQLSIRLRPVLLDQLARHADMSGESMSEVVAAALRAHLGEPAPAIPGLQL